MTDWSEFEKVELAAGQGKSNLILLLASELKREWGWRRICKSINFMPSICRKVCAALIPCYGWRRLGRPSNGRILWDFVLPYSGAIGVDNTAINAICASTPNFFYKPLCQLHWLLHVKGWMGWGGSMMHAYMSVLVTCAHWVLMTGTQVWVCMCSSVPLVVTMTELLPQTCCRLLFAQVNGKGNIPKLSPKPEGVKLETAFVPVPSKLWCHKCPYCIYTVWLYT